MTAMASSPSAGPPLTADRLRHDIDRGRAADKVSFPDPAAAPLGTEEEAAGAAPSPEAVRQARDHELTRGQHPSPAVTGERARLVPGKGRFWWREIPMTATLFFGIAALLVVFVLWTV